MLKKTVSILLALTLILSIAAFVPAAAADDGLIAHWKLDSIENGKVEDCSGNGYTGTFEGSEPEITDGVSGKAFKFGADKSPVVIQDSPSLKFSKSSSYTISLWLRSDGITGWESVIQKGRRSGSNNYGIWMIPSGKKIQYCIGNDRIGTETMPTNEWIYYTVVQDGAKGTRTIYYNGRESVSQATVDMNEQPGVFTIGGVGGSVGEMFNGAIDDVRIYSRALEKTEILDLFIENAETYTVSGKAVSSVTGAAAGGIRLTLCKNNKDLTEYMTAVTDKDGKYEFYGIEKGSYIIKNTADDNYRESTCEITVSGNNITQDITLYPPYKRYTVSFVTEPADAEIRVFDGEKVIKPQTDGTYSLTEGEYTYTVRKDGYTSKTEVLRVEGGNALINVSLNKKSDTLTISEEDMLDHIKGGWIGQMAGVTWGGPTEFNYRHVIIPKDKVPVWTPETINEVFIQDDLCAEVPILQCMDKYGVTAGWDKLGKYWADNKIWIIGANGNARTNLQNGIPAPESGHYKNNGCCDDIDWQIDADSMGMLAAGRPEIARELAWRVGHLMGFGDGVYGGVFVASLYAAGLTAGSVDEMADIAVSGIPQNTKFYKTMKNVIDSYDSGKTWQEAWEALETPEMQEWRSNFYQRADKPDMNMSAKLNSAYILIGLLYGGGDIEKSMEISMRCGHDSDCNPSSIGGILGYRLGLKNIDEKWYSALNSSKNFHETSYSPDKCIEVTLKLTGEVVRLNGGSTDGDWQISGITGNKALIREQWPEDEDNEMPSLSASAVKDTTDPTGRTYMFTADAADADGIAEYQWFFGDLKYESGSSVKHTFLNDEIYEAICYTADTVGNTAYKTVKVYVNTSESSVGLIARWDFDDLKDGKIPDTTGNGHDAAVTGSPTFTEGVTGKAIEFNADGQLATVPASTDFQFLNTDSFSLTAWVKRQEDNRGWQAVIQTGRETWKDYFGLWIADGDKYDFGGHNQNNIYSGTGYKKDDWHHIALVQDGEKSARTLYIDGTAVATGSAASVTSGSVLTFGGYPNDEYFRGQLDDVRLYNIALGIEQLAAIRKESANGDVNNDGKINILDLIRLKKHTAANKTPLEIPRADLDLDGKIGAVDLSVLKKFLLNATL